MKRFTRREFLNAAGCLAAAGCTASVFMAGHWATGLSRSVVRVRPVDVEEASLADQSFCARARFATAADAVRVCASRGMTVEVYRETV